MIKTKTRSQLPQLTIGKGRHVGRRRAHKANQDHLGSYDSVIEDRIRLAQKGQLYVVADGMGGAAGGEVASQIAVQRTLQRYYKDKDLDVPRSLNRAIQSANWQIHQQSNREPAYHGMGTTIVAAVVHDDILTLANVGDSRAYLLRNGRLQQISTDHTLVQEHVRAGVLTPEQAAIHPRRNTLSRNLGFAPQARPDIVSKKLQKGDILLLCSDGLWGEVSDKEMAKLLREHTPEDAAQELIDLANENGGRDNISLIALRVEELPTGTQMVQYRGAQKPPSAKSTVKLQPAKSTPKPQVAKSTPKPQYRGTPKPQSVKSRQKRRPAKSIHKRQPVLKNNNIKKTKHISPPAPAPVALATATGPTAASANIKFVLLTLSVLTTIASLATIL
ncbi:MAG: Stp1/IreP family PP2C-type Ser/Thr phosphatase [Ardenticatenaceae bacterium]